MNKIITILQEYTGMILTVSLIMFASSTLVANNGESDNTIENRVLSLPSAIDVKYTKEVVKRVDQYTVKNRATTEVLLGRTSMYFPSVEQIFREKGLPDDLKYLAVIESGLRPYVTSRSGASGMWQIMKPTGKMLGLSITKTIDERRDVEKSTYAAADYLLHLYKSFGDWTLAIAAYNCGPGNLRKAIRNSGGKSSFWEIKNFLPRETREYVPKFIAMSYVMNYYYMHDLVPQVLEENLTNTSIARVYETIDLSKLGEELSLDMEVISILNPAFIKNIIPQCSEGSHILTLPTREMRIVATKYHVLAQLPVETPRGVDEIIAPEARPMVEVSMLPTQVFNYGNGGRHGSQPTLKSTSVYYLRIEEEVTSPRYFYRLDPSKLSIDQLNSMINE